MGSLMIAFSLRTFCCCSSSLLISVNGETYKSVIKRLIKIQTHHVVRKHLTATVTDKKLVIALYVFLCIRCVSMFVGA